MTPKIEATSSKPSFRWPWSKKRRAGEQRVARQHDLDNLGPTQPVAPAESNAERSSTISIEHVQATLPITVSSSGATSSYREADSYASSPVRTMQADTPPTFFPNASHWVVNGLQINANQHGPSSNDNGWERLMENTAPNALHDSEHRFDQPKCDEDTRVEVIQELMGWIQDRESPQRLLCMTGAAGSGKSALQQTVAELCSGKGILASTFFFSSTDSTRNTVSALIPTIAYQIGSNNFTFREAISVAVTKDPLIFKKSLRTQMNKLIVDPIENLTQAISKPELLAIPYAILIDGLDECADEERQAELLSTIDECLLQNEALPFRVFIASRPEWAIRSALEDTGYLHQKAYHVQLSDQYDASSDIRRVLWRRLRDIGRRSGDPQARSPSWPLKRDIETLVANASGQFIYAATVLKFVSERRSSPVERLRVVITWTPKDRAQPFAALDLLYSSIVSAAKEAYEAAHPERDFLLLLSILRLLDRLRFQTRPTFQQIASLEEDAHRWLISDLQSLVIETSGRTALRYYHKSFPDFLDNSRRSKTLFVPESRIVEFVTVSCFSVLGSVMDRNEPPPVPPPIRVLVTNLLVLEFGRANAEYTSSIPNFLAAGNSIEKLKKWKAVERCMEEGRSDKDKDWGFQGPSEVTDSWLKLLAHALLDTNSYGEDILELLQAFHDKWHELCQNPQWPRLDDSDG